MTKANTRARRSPEQRERERLAASKARDLAFVQHPEDWPHCPILPLKLRNGHILDAEFCALLFANGKPLIYLANLHDLPAIMPAGKLWTEVLSAFKQREFPSFEVLLDQYTVD
jgi:hypothetical protein